MTRIIAGAAGGRRLSVPRGQGTRPTSERVRESLFSRLESLDAIRDRRVLDLFAGSGALGLEAVSRGAAAAVLVEREHRAAACARGNAENLDLPGVRVVAADAAGWVSRAARAGERFGLVLLDPPYAFGDTPLARLLTALTPLLASDAVVAVERDARSGEPAWPAPLRALPGRTTGDTSVHLARAVVGGGAVAGSGSGPADCDR